MAGTGGGAPLLRTLVATGDGVFATGAAVLGGSYTAAALNAGNSNWY